MPNDSYHTDTFYHGFYLSDPLQLAAGLAVFFVVIGGSALSIYLWYNRRK
jgi:hypothetical protein